MARQRRSTAPAAKNAPPPSSRRAQQSTERRQQILAAALDEFSANGFAATRLDDVAKRAGVAKGTIYLYFKDKEALFQELLRAQIGPVIGTLEKLLATDAAKALPVRELALRVVELFAEQVLHTRRRDIVRLILTEGPRFPALAEFYYREVISRGMTALRNRMQQAVNAGELRSDALVRFPQLMVAPGLVALIWRSTFEQYEPLDVKAFMRAHIDSLFGEENKQ